MANSFIICFAFIAGFIVAKTYVDLVESPLKEAGTFWMYGSICFVGGLFTAIFVPETRNKSVEEIQNYFSGKAKSKEEQYENGTQMQQLKWAKIFQTFNKWSWSDCDFWFYSSFYNLCLLLLMYRITHFVTIQQWRKNSLADIISQTKANKITDIKPAYETSWTKIIDR